LSKIGLEAKRYGIKNSIANLMNQLGWTLDAIIVLRLDQLEEGSIAFGVQKKDEILLLVHLTH
jgi:hypothetical protein